jgi:YD repeat-containing protein
MKVLNVIDEKTTEDLEAYAYDKAGNITVKTIQGQKTTMTYNAANELASASMAGVGTITYNYDKAGRLLSYSGGPTNTYGWLDKVVKTTDAHGSSVALTYWPDGQLAAEGSAATFSKAAYIPGEPDTEHFLWDGLALLRRDDTVYISEPHPSGGAAVASHSVGSDNEITLAVVRGNQIVFENLTSFGQLRRPAQALPQPTALQAPALASPRLSSLSQIPSVR